MNEEPLEPYHAEEPYDSEHVDVLELDESASHYDVDEKNAKEKPDG